MTKLKVQIAHQVPGRIRMKIGAGKGNPELLAQVKETFLAIPGIEQVVVNETTGSIVIQYDTDRHDEFHSNLHQHTGGHVKPPTNEIDAMADKIAEEAEFLAQNSHTARVIVDFCKEIDRNIKVSTGNTLDLKIVLAFGIAGITIAEVGAHAATPVWVTLAMFGLNHFIEAHSADLDKADDGSQMSAA